MSQTHRPKISAGYQVGMLTVTAATEKRKNSYIIWECRCSCGGSVLLDTRTLQQGNVTSCGCQTSLRSGAKDLTGRRFGRLVCVEPTQLRGPGGTMIWNCLCDCGNTCQADSSHLTKGAKKSCGCWGHPPRKELEGKRFGMLTVVDYAGKRAGMHRWKCLCDCGKETIVGQTLLQSGKTRSCGCLQKTVIYDNLLLYGGTSVTLLEAGKRRKNPNNKSGYTGVYQDARTGKWQAQIKFQKKTYYLGSYDNIQDAVDARKRGEKMHEDFLNWFYCTYPDKKKGDILHDGSKK